jgi:hypothetical protein
MRTIGCIIVLGALILPACGGEAPSGTGESASSTSEAVGEATYTAVAPNATGRADITKVDPWTRPTAPPPAPPPVPSSGGSK